MAWNDRFHRRIGEVADNRYLPPGHRRLLTDHARIGETFRRGRDADMRARIAIAAARRDRSVDLIAAGDEAGVVALILEHRALSRDHFEMFMRPDPLPAEPF